MTNNSSILFLAKFPGDLVLFVYLNLFTSFNALSSLNIFGINKPPPWEVVTCYLFSNLINLRLARKLVGSFQLI